MVVLGETEPMPINDAINTLIDLGCYELAGNYQRFLLDKQRAEYWLKYFNPVIYYEGDCVTYTIAY